MNGDEGVVLRAVDLSLGYGDGIVLAGVDLEVREGEFWFLIGPNGEGKSTLVRAVLGLLRPLRGVLWMHPALTDRKRMGFVPQRCDLNPSLPTTAREFVALGLVGVRGRASVRREAVRWALEKVGLKDMETTDYWSLSGGQRQRALIARALVRRPRLLILDEATNGLDLPTEDFLMRFLERLNQEERITILFVTHDLGVAVRYGSHAAIFHEGRVRSGPREETLSADLLARTYGIPVEVHREGNGSVCIRVGGQEVAP